MFADRIIRTVAIALLLAGTVTVYGAETVPLPGPRIRGQFMKSLKNHVTIKGFSTRELTDQVLADILWAGFGVTDQQTGRRTAQSAFNMQEIDIYVLSASGAYRYDALANMLETITGNDLRGIVATQAYASNAPIHLLYVADYGKAEKRVPDSYRKRIPSWAMMHTGFIAQNVFIYCAVNGMTSVVREVSGAERLRRELRLRDSQALIMSQAVGYSPL